VPSGWRRAEVHTVDFVAGAQSARGLTVVIDVFRAFSLAAHAFARGVRAIVPVADIDYARELKRLHPDWLLIGERYARALPGFDSGNSPADLERFDLSKRTLIHTTHSGTQGLTAARAADEVITGALVNAGAIVRYIQSRAPAVVTLVRMGKQAQQRCEEDDLCAQLLQQRLAGETPAVDDMPQRLRGADSAAMFFDPACDWAPQRDFELCTQVDAFDFVLRLERSEAPARLERTEVPK
jgi:2-phosphosulfolactate phosphatase